jgi:hypothetical protein
VEKEHSLAAEVVAISAISEFAGSHLLNLISITKFIVLQTFRR